MESLAAYSLTSIHPALNVSSAKLQLSRILSRVLERTPLLLEPFGYTFAWWAVVLAAAVLALVRAMGALAAQQAWRPGWRTVAHLGLVVWLARVARAVRAAQPELEHSLFG